MILFFVSSSHFNLAACLTFVAWSSCSFQYLLFSFYSMSFLAKIKGLNDQTLEYNFSLYWLSYTSFFCNHKQLMSLSLMVRTAGSVKGDVFVSYDLSFSFVNRVLKLWTMGSLTLIQRMISKLQLTCFVTMLDGVIRFVARLFQLVCDFNYNFTYIYLSMNM